MNPFLKAGILTALVVLLAFFVVSQIDAMRSNELKKSVEGIVYEKQAEDVLHDYARVMAKTPQEQCPYLQTLRQRQMDKTYSIALKIQDYQRSNMLNDEYEQLKTAYFLSLSGMYISSFENKQSCGLNEVSLAFFYAEKNCPDCLAQNAVLTKVAARCPNVRIYAFPTDYSLEPLSLLSSRYSISSAPSIVIEDGNATKGVQSEEALVLKLKNAGASCS